MRALAPLVLPWCLACSDSVARALDQAGIDLLVAVSVDGGKPRSVALGRTSDPARFDRTEKLVLFGLEADSLVFSDGSTAIAGITARLDSTPAPIGSCDRCPGVGVRAPLVVQPGASCRPPSFARVWTEDADGLEEVPADAREDRVGGLRALVRLDWPGPCALAPGSLELTSTALAFEQVYPADEGAKVTASTILPSGEVVVFGRDFAVRTGSDALETRDVPFVGWPISAVSLEDGSVLVLSPDVSRPRPKRFDLFDRALAHRELSLSGGVNLDVPLDHTPAAGRLQRAFLPVPKAALLQLGIERDVPHLLVSGRQVTGAGQENLWPRAVFLCAIEADALSCEQITPSDLFRVSSHSDPPFAAILENGAIVAVTGGAVALGRPAGSDWSWQSAPLIPASERIAMSIDAVGDSAVICLSARAGDRVFLGRHFSSSDRDPASGWTELRRDAGATCPLFASARGSARLLSRDPSVRGQLIEIDLRSFAVRDLPIESFASPLLEPEWIEAPWPGWYLSYERGRFYRAAETSSTTIDFERVFGSTELDLSAIWAWSNQPDDTFIGFVQGGQRVFVDGNGSVRREASPSSNPAQIICAAPTSAGGHVVGGDGYAAWVSDETDEVELGRAEALYDVVEVAPGEAIGAADRWMLLHLAGRSAAEIPIEWDDPTTPETEVAPADHGDCFITDQRGLPAWHWNSVDSSAGVAWAVGCGGHIVRISRRSDRSFYAERFAFARVEESTGTDDDRMPPLFSTLRVLAPDHVLIGALGQTPVTASSNLFWAIEPAKGREQLRLRQIDLETFDAGVSWAPGPPVELLGSPPRMFSAGLAGVLSLGGTPRVPISELRGATMNARGRILVSAVGPRLYLSKE
ncbi:MAG: hypothetical protein HY791_14850 [Deltaproteobacteria bacterium]|nr:hypothetical protein [Deltaproteobacteria bacterium]